ncbi:hypothetical protein [Nocardioides terrisoli]|uniref:hypothetical protein n=1 Tax=Nocardioides terrisoli TaxID=3388267 RepID=UPI00287B69FE|nr:hypothetical protein [Nocardioides marmorisolisilvae]
MGKAAAQWRKTVDIHFGYLKDFGFRRVDSDDSSFWSLWVQYRSPTAALRVSKSNEFVRAEVHLIRLVDGEVPAYPIWITDARIDWTLLDNVVEARRPELLDEASRQHGLKASEIEGQLSFWANVLKEVASDFLDGDFAPIDEAGALVRLRVAEHPQEVKVWIPNDAPEGAEIGESAAVEATLPSNVGVSVRRYWRGRRSKPK